MLPALVNNYRTYELTQYLKRVGHKFTKPPTIKLARNSVRYSEDNFCNPQASSSSYNRPYSPRYDNPSSKLEGQTPAPDLNNVVCHCCQKKGHYASSCPSASKNLFRSSKTNVHFINENNQEGYYEECSDSKKRPGRVDAEYSTLAIPSKPIPPDIPTNVIPDSSLLCQLEQTSPIHCTKLKLTMHTLSLAPWCNRSKSKLNLKLLNLMLDSF